MPQQTFSLLYANESYYWEWWMTQSLLSSSYSETTNSTIDIISNRRKLYWYSVPSVGPYKKGMRFKSNPCSLARELVYASPTVQRTVITQHYSNNGVLFPKNIQTTDRVVYSPENARYISVAADIEGLKRIASERYYDKLSKLKINLAVTFKERQKTYDMVADAATRIFRAVVSLRKGKIKEGFYHLTGQKFSNTKAKRFNGHTAHKNKPFSENWLALQYGWGPLLSDVYGSMILTHNDIPSFWITGHASADFSSPSEGQYFSVTRFEVSVKYKSLCRYNATVLKAHEAGMLNPALVAWELTSFSFVLDWFFPIGTMIESFGTLIGLERSEDSETINIDYEAKGKYDPPAEVSWSGTTKTEKSLVYQAASSSYKRKTKTRVLTAPVVYLPEFNLGLSPHRALSAIALLSQLRK